MYRSNVYWIFLSCCNLIMPVLMIGFGFRFVRKPPAQINRLYGYRTARSMRSQESWTFAHRYFGKLWLRLGLLLLLVTVLVCLSALLTSSGTARTLCTWLWAGQLFVLIFPVFFTERALKRGFE